MAIAGVDVFDQSVDTSNEWLDELTHRLAGDDRRQAYLVLRAYLQVLRDRLPVDRAARLAACLPHPLRGVFYEGWDPGGAPETYRDRETFLARLADGARLRGPSAAARAAHAATGVLRERAARSATTTLRPDYTDYADASTELVREGVTASEVDAALEVLPEAVRTLLGAPAAPPERP
jgi:uncharacterized protein (DUF2267 family)